MFLRELTLRNFRNYREQSLTFNKNVNILVGGNAQGKTNLLEAIYCLCTCKSHRTHRDEEMIFTGKQGFYLKGEFESDEGRFDIELVNLLDGKKRAKFNGKSVERLSDLIGIAKVVMFSPESLQIVKGPPAERRRFLDVLISQLDRIYLHHLQSYQAVLKQRNELLKQIRDGVVDMDLLTIWDEQLLDYGLKVAERRREIIDRITAYAREIHSELSGGESLSLAYLVNGYDASTVKLKELLTSSLEEAREYDITRGSTSVGPHRDDMGIYLDGVDARRFCSQGQQRTISLSLRISEYRMIKDETGEEPLILLDDVASELDPFRASLLYEMLNGINAQIFLTTTHLDEPAISGEFDVFDVVEGSVRCRG
ncbi:TPA: DNA replication/repair protein RecF [Candidatus Poribacteria bacterium]|nr:DNA replication/repair protein RecF [Candidatus Poribacteria bacterium]